MGRSACPSLSVRGGDRTADHVQEVVGSQGLGPGIVKRSGINKAQIAVARKLAVIMHQMWTIGEKFRWSNKENDVEVVAA